MFVHFSESSLRTRTKKDLLGPKKVQYRGKANRKPPPANRRTGRFLESFQPSLIEKGGRLNLVDFRLSLLLLFSERVDADCAYDDCYDDCC